MPLSSPSFVSDLLTTPIICDRLGISRWTWMRWVKAGEAPAPVEGLPGFPRWNRRDIDRFARGRVIAVPGRRAFFGTARQSRAKQVNRVAVQ